VTLNADLEQKIPKHQFIHYMDKSTGTLPSLEEKKALPNCGNKDGSIIHVNIVYPPLLQQFRSV